MTPKQRHELVKDIATKVFLANVLDSHNHDRYGDIAERAVIAANALADALPDYQEPAEAHEVTSPVMPESDGHELHDK